MSYNSHLDTPGWTFDLSKRPDKLLSTFFSNSISPDLEYRENCQSDYVMIKTNIVRDPQFFCKSQTNYLSGYIHYHFPLSEMCINFNHLTVTLYRYYGFTDIFLQNGSPPSIEHIYTHMKKNTRGIIEAKPVDLSCTNFSHVTFTLDRLPIKASDGLFAIFTYYWSGPPPSVDEEGNWTSPVQYELSVYQTAHLKLIQ